ncbi:hypothetical protein [Pseudothioclava nitratireducens]|nr:hypothetical protein [Defluviimonas nitratireducens]MDF1620757.1 hypothetical protein [Defluviimonas nitratireducens]
MASGSLERTLAARAGSVCPNGYREVSRLPIAGADRLSDTTYRVTIICN